MKEKLENVKNYILQSILPSKDAQEIAKVLEEAMEELKTKKK